MRSSFVSVVKNHTVDNLGQIQLRCSCHRDLTGDVGATGGHFDALSVILLPIASRDPLMRFGVIEINMGVTFHPQLGIFRVRKIKRSCIVL